MSSMMENAYITGYRGFPIGGGEGDRCNRAVYKNELWERECSHSVCGKWFQSGHTPSPHVFVTNRLLRSKGNGSTFSLKRRRKKKREGRDEMHGYVSKIFFLSFFLSFFLFFSIPRGIGTGVQGTVSFDSFQTSFRRPRRTVSLGARNE